MTKPDTNRLRNVVGPKLRIMRDKNEWSQPDLAAKCQLHGWNVSRDIIARIELQIRWVADFELMILAHVFGVTANDLLPKHLDLESLALADQEE